MWGGGRDHHRQVADLQVEYMGHDAAAQERAKLVLDETRRRLLPEAGTREEAFELLSDDLVEERLLRFMALVLVHEVPDRDRRGGTQRKTIRPIGRGGT